ncbi:hypothetical protein P4493_05845 [Bacillus thuringiensis]|jgi:hypothetical protein|uniref:Uncharacterized protein n=3 Tax=Bacillus thuringiensis TaxID=1428 RepID=A0A0B5NC82_BACTU|nr:MULTISPECIES: hypothetical protein [Bacillus]MEC2533085.1 hypothetical protein [Bacillus cereus]MED1153935.1 hypothetical protein [Bacillus paranthracis]OUB09225.1 hypothetical protein BK708_32330 [Bacillus thuringiensis serovar yunnanensis]AFQ29807.1 hypothetical protein BTF1_28532 [Bacillus thuringiensis HD-789]AJG74000.1 hypothetical protein BF38_6051 [Bacillus thuringiensis]
MLFITTVQAKQSDIKTSYVYDTSDNLVLDGAESHTFLAWCDLMGVDSCISETKQTLQAITITNRVVNRDIVVQEFEELDEVPKDVKYLRAETVVETANDTKCQDILCFVHVGEERTTIYKPVYESKYHAHPRTLLSKEDYNEKVAPIILQVNKGVK